MAQAATIKPKTQMKSDILTNYAEVEDYLLSIQHIDNLTKDWLHVLIDRWELWKKGKVITDTLIQYFDTAPNPYISTLRIVVYTLKSKQLANEKPPFLPNTVVEQFLEWVGPRKGTYRDCLKVNLKIAAFSLLAKCKNRQLIALMAVVYDFMEHKEEFVKLIEAMIMEGKFREAAHYIGILQLQDHFPNPETILMPLIMQNKTNVVDEFLTICPTMQMKLVVYLDKLLNPKVNIRNVFYRIIDANNLQNMENSIMKPQAIAKLTARLVKTYNLPLECCINLSNQRTRGAMHFLVRKRYVEGTLGIDSLREMLVDTIGDNKEMQREVIKLLVHRNDNKEALYWAKKFKVPEMYWPYSVKFADDEEKCCNVRAQEQPEECWDNGNSECYHELTLPRNRVQVADNYDSFLDLLDIGLKGVNKIGFDCEWKPSFGNSEIKQSNLALLQIATVQDIYIIDVATIGDKFHHLWERLATELFSNTKILKLGFGICHDMKVIRDSVPALSKIQTHGDGYLDIESLWSELVQNYDFTFPYEALDPKNKGGLSKLVELCLGRPLNKSDQCSNWIKRPLREAQIIYAAIDAFCLLEVYSVMENIFERLFGSQITFDRVCANLGSNAKVTKENAKTRKEIKLKAARKPTEKPSKIENPIKAEIPAKIETPVKTEKPVRIENQVIKKEKSIQIEESTKTKAPVQIEKPPRIKKPVQIEKPAQIEKPVEIEKPTKTKKPVEIEKPTKTKKPVEIEKPAPLEEPAQIKKPSKTKKPAKIENPVKVEKPVQTKNPVKVEKPVQTKKPGKTKKTPKTKKCPKAVKSVNRPGTSVKLPINDKESDCRDLSNHCHGNDHLDNNCDYYIDDYLLNHECEGCRRKLKFQIQSIPIPIQQWRVVCDSMLIGLTRKLRQCGCDCTYVKSDEVDSSARFAMMTNRVLLTTDPNYLEFTQYLQPDKCYRVKEESPDSQLQEVLHYFGVVMTGKNVIRR